MAERIVAAAKYAIKIEDSGGEKLKARTLNQAIKAICAYPFCHWGDCEDEETVGATFFVYRKGKFLYEIQTHYKGKKLSLVWIFR